jgi:outer membrane lipoprotein-sorting protein
MWLALLMVLSVSAQDNNEAEQLFQTMEAKLDKAKALNLSFDVKIEEGELPGFPKGTGPKGTLAVMSGNEFRLEFRGGKNPGDDGKPHKVLWISDGTQSMMTVSGEGKPKPGKTPKNLAAGFMTVVARPGVLMSQSPLPDVAVADEKERFPVSGFQLGKKERVGERETQRLDYHLAVKGQNPRFSVTVWIDLKTGLPVKRRVTGGVGEEKLAYSETYELKLDGKLDPKLFELPK